MKTKQVQSWKAMSAILVLALKWATPEVVHAAGFISAAPIVPARSVERVVLLPSGRVLATPNYSSVHCDIYDPASNAWTPAQPPAAPRAASSGTLLESGLVLIAGGVDFDGYTHAETELYDETSNTWSPAAPMLIGSNQHSAIRLLSGKVLVFGGWKSGTTVWNSTLNASVQLYDPASNTWSLAGTLAFPRDSHSATLLSSGKVMIAGGHNIAGRLAAVELYDPATNSWSLASPMLEARDLHSATLLADGKILVTGGDTYWGRIASTELYDPATDTWVPDEPLAIKRDYHSATRLADGNVLVIGGYDFPAIIANAELYDFQTHTWKPAGMSVTPRLIHRATLLPSGRVLVVGGRNDGGQLSSAELYAPETTTSLSISSASTQAGESYLVEVYVNGLSGEPNGSVTVDDGAGESCGPVELSAGHAACALISVVAGNHQVSANFLPADGSFTGSSATLDHVVDPIPSEIAITGVDPQPSVVGQPVEISFSTTLGATGMVTVSASTGEHCDASVAVGHCAIAFFVDGPRSLMAHYFGDATYTESVSGSVPHEVDDAATTVSITGHSPDPSIPYQTIIVGVSFSVQSPGAGVPLGQVYVGDGVDQCTIAEGQTDAQCTLTLTTRGPRTLTARYFGDGNYASSEDSVIHRVNRLPELGKLAYAIGTGGELTVTAAEGVLAGASDADGDQLVILNPGPQSTQGVGGTATLDADGGFTFLPSASVAGVATFSVSISDGLEIVDAVVSITVNPMADLAVTLEDGLEFAEGGHSIEYTLEVRNRGALTAGNASVRTFFPTNLVDTAWSCVSQGGATCGGSGVGDINESVNIQAGSRIVYLISASVVAEPEMSLTVSAQVFPAPGVADANPGNDEAIDVNVVGIFADAFEGVQKILH